MRQPGPCSRCRCCRAYQGLIRAAPAAIVAIVATTRCVCRWQWPAPSGCGSKPVAAGAHLFSSGDRFTALYAIHSGSIKTCVGSEAGVQHITGFHLPAELTGFDGIASGIHTNDGVAMETTTVCRIPYLQLLQLMRKLPSLQHHLLWLLGRRIAGDFRIFRALNTKCAVARVALMLVGLSQRFQARRYSASSYRLPMTRGDIGNYLGLEIETISRALSALHAAGAVEIAGREVHINDLALLKRISQQAGAADSAEVGDNRYR